ncbi:roadblock/LC7 domain-containing protein [Vulcanisaeta distributa]|uniref:roadblock/LC7 domain-containing protein n=1 Tax=Vulcanisaeta distributa TaxID=164451 RepID=UPI0006D2C11E|nr:roadblock/LC7 domain-containing protein [Vulcanisaeta distributa]
MLSSTNSASSRRTLTEHVQKKLNEILESSDLIKFVALVTMDGFTIDSRMKDDINVDPKWLGALIISSIRNLELNLKKVLNEANLSELVISLGQNLLIVKSIGKLALIMIVDKTLDMNVVMYEIEEGLRDLTVDLGLG